VDGQQLFEMGEGRIGVPGHGIRFGQHRAVVWSAVGAKHRGELGLQDLDRHLAGCFKSWAR
jgi:hypothetical protein